MATAPVGRPKKAAKPPTEQEKKILALTELKSKDKASPAQLDELKKLVASERKATLIRLATKRTNRLIGLMKQIGNLGAYKPSDTQTKAVFGKIKEAVDLALTKWEGNKSVEPEFELPTE